MKTSTLSVARGSSARRSGSPSGSVGWVRFPLERPQRGEEKRVLGCLGSRRAATRRTASRQNTYRVAGNAASRRTGVAQGVANQTALPPALAESLAGAGALCYRLQPMFPRRSILLLLTGVLVGPAQLGCGAGPYGFARTYAHASGEVDAAEGAREYDPVMVGRQFPKWVGQKVTLFGIVKAREDLSDGSAMLKLSIRTRQARNLCESSNEETCRVTVTDNEFGTAHASVRLVADDANGPLSVRPGSLVRVIGTISAEPNKQTGNTVVVAKYFRHWPADYFVTTKARAYMRQ